MRLIEFIDNIIIKILGLFGLRIKKGLLQFFRYLLCGGTATICDMTTLFILTKFLSLNHLFAAALGFSVGVATNYYLNTILVFKSSGKIKKEFSLFLIIGIGGLFWTEFILWILVDNFSFPLILAKIVSVILVLNWNFFMRKSFVFAEK